VGRAAVRPLSELCRTRLCWTATETGARVELAGARSARCEVFHGSTREAGSPLRRRRRFARPRPPRPGRQGSQRHNQRDQALHQVTATEWLRRQAADRTGQALWLRVHPSNTSGQQRSGPAAKEEDHGRRDHHLRGVWRRHGATSPPQRLQLRLRRLRGPLARPGLGDPPRREPSSAGVRIGNTGLTSADVAICGRGPTWTVGGQRCARQ